jgi:hypothetical protein
MRSWDNGINEIMGQWGNKKMRLWDYGIMG